MRNRAEAVGITNPEYSPGGEVIELVVTLAVVAAIAALLAVLYKRWMGHRSLQAAQQGVPVPVRAAFCPKCGSGLPTGVAFCPECGTYVGDRQGSVAAATSLAVRAGFTPVDIAGRVAAAIVGICMFVPWASVPALNTLGSYASMFGIGSGGGFDYTIPAMGDSINSVSYLIGSSGLRDLYALLLGAWGIALILLLGGMVASLVGARKGGLLTVGCLSAALVAVAWAFLTLIVNTAAGGFEVISVAGGCIGTIVVGFGAFVLMLAGRAKA